MNDNSLIHYPTEMGKCSPFFPSVQRRSIPLNKPETYETSWAKFKVYGYTLISIDQALLMVLLNMPYVEKDNKMEITTTLYQICTTLYGRNPSNKDYERIRLSLRAIFATGFEIQTKNWTLLNHLCEIAWENQDTETGMVFIKINKALVDLIFAGMTKPVSLPIYNQLSNLGKLLYMFITMHKGPLTLNINTLQSVLNATDWKISKFRFEVIEQANLLKKLRRISSFRVNGKGIDTQFKIDLTGQKALPSSQREG